MRVPPEFRDREETQVAVLNALVGRADDGMTVLELRSGVDATIDEVEDALSALKSAGLIEVEQVDGVVRIYPDDRVVPDAGEHVDEEPGLLDSIRRRLGL
jgi:DNA-binding transcriptional ArsR family regulator